MSEPLFPEPVSPYPEEIIAAATGITFSDDTIQRLASAIVARMNKPFISSLFPRRITEILPENNGFVWRTALPLYQGNTIIIDAYITSGVLLLEFRDRDGDLFWTGRFGA